MAHSVDGACQSVCLDDFNTLHARSVSLPFFLRARKQTTNMCTVQQCIVPLELRRASFNDACTFVLHSILITDCMLAFDSLVGWCPHLEDPRRINVESAVIF